MHTCFKHGRHSPPYDFLRYFMKESPQSKKLEEMLRSSKLSAGGFMGQDSRSVSELIDNDLAIITASGLTKEQVAARMREITNMAIPLLGNWTEIDRSCMPELMKPKGRLFVHGRTPEGSQNG